MVDRAPDIASLTVAWRSLGQRVAVAGGCLVGLLSLFHHVSASTAALRGAATWIGVLALTRFSGFVLAHACRFDVVDAVDELEEETRV
jgi:hypothetical protein